MTVNIERPITHIKFRVESEIWRTHVMEGGSP